MINISTNRNKYILRPTVPSGTEDIQYTVYIGATTIFVGKTKYFGGTYEVDLSDFIESYLASRSYDIYIISLRVLFSYDNGSSTQQMTYTWNADVINLPWDYPAQAMLQARLCGFKMLEEWEEGSEIEYSNAPVNIPLVITNELLAGKTINKLDKVTYMDRYGYTYNGSMTNSYEVECFIDPCWLKMSTGNDMEYEKVILALQNAKKTVLFLNMTAESNNRISGMELYDTGLGLEVRVKDIEKIETYSSYSTSKKIPSYKLTLEIIGNNEQ